MGSLQEAFIHPPEQCEAHFIIDGRALFEFFWTVEKNTAIIKLRRARTIFLIIQIGFIKSYTPRMLWGMHM